VIKVISPTAESPPAALPTLTAQSVTFALVVPHVPEPILPVETLNVDFGRSPVEVMVSDGGMPFNTLHPFSPLAFRNHCTKNTVSPGLNPLPLM
jgi:hypothetical protein